MLNFLFAFVFIFLLQFNYPVVNGLIYLVYFDEF